MSDTLLTYSIETNPDPIQISPTDGAPSLATLTITVSNSPPPDPVTGLPPAHPPIIQCSSIVFNLHKGFNAKDFGSDLTIAGSSAPEGWHIDPDGNGNFTVTPTTSSAPVGSEGLVFVLEGIKVNLQPGTTWMTITETAARPNEDPDDRITSISLGKFPLKFSVGDLDANPQSVALNGSTTLTWNGTEGAEYTLEYDDVVIQHTKSGEALPASGSYKIDGLQRDTVFNLLVRYVENPASIAKVQRSRTVTILEAHIDNFVADPLTIGKGLPCEVQWETNADTCTLDYAGQTVQVAAPNGSTTLTFDASTTVTLTAKRGSSVAQEPRAITVDPPKIKSFTTSTPGPITSGTDPVTLTWDTQYAETISITPDIGVVGPTGSQVVHPVNTTTYTLRCTGLGPDVVQQVTVAVHSVVINSFSVSPAAIAPGGTTGLSWDTQLATSVSIDNGIGDVSASGSCSTHGAPQNDITYRLTCEGPNGPVSSSVTLKVNCVRIDFFRIQCSDDWETDCILEWGVEFAAFVSIGCDAEDIIPSSLAIMAGSSGSVPYHDPKIRMITFTLTAWGPGVSPIQAQQFTSNPFS
jgi:hypothetical protein